MTTAIEVRGLTKRFGDHLAVDDASFAVPYGAVTGFVGANGSGKTTTIRMVLGLTRPSTGEALVGGKPYAALSRPRRTVGAVADRVGAFPGMTAVRHLRVVAAGGALDEARIPSVLERVGLSDAGERRVGSFSTGMRQRLALAAALLGEPRILVLDEPASGLDPAGIRWIRNLMREQARDGAAVFVSTHQLAELAAVVNRVVLIDQGRILADQPTDTLLAETGRDDLESAVFAMTGAEDRR